MNDLLSAFSATKPYQGKTLVEWLTSWVTLREADLIKFNVRFLTIMTTWVVRKFQQRRKGEVPIGNLAKFTLPENQELNFIGALCAMVVSVFRERGLVEADSQPTNQFQKLLDAFNRSRRIQ